MTVVEGGQETYGVQGRTESVKGGREERRIFYGEE